MSHNQDTSQEQKTTDNIFEFPFYNRKGKLNHKLINPTAFLIYITTLFTLYNTGAALYYYLQLKINIFTHYKEFIEQSIVYIQDKVLDIEEYGMDAFIENELLIISSLFITPLLTVALFIYWILKKARIQSNLSSVGLEHYYLKSIDKKNKSYTFKLLKGHKMAYETFVNQFDNLKQLFGEGDIEYNRYKADMVKVRFKDAVIDLNTLKQSNTKLSLKKHLQEDKLLLGATSLNGDVLYATSKEEGQGLLNGAWLIVGASGSGKSVSVKSFCMNFLLPENYKYIDDIYVINYKQSSDYNFLKPLDKVHYAQDIKDGLKLLKLIQLNMFNKYLYNSKHDQDNFIDYQSIVIIDEIQTLPELLDSKGLHKIERNSIQESLSIIEMLGSKARASNISLMVILQKADVTSLPSTAFRQNLRNRFMLKQENNVSAVLVINNEILERENIRPLELTQGQFIYLDTLTNELKRGLTIFPDTKIDIELLNSQGFDEETQIVIDEVQSNKSASLAAIKEQKEELESLSESGKKTYYDGFDDVEKENTDNKEVVESTKDIDILDEIDNLLS